MDYFADQLRQVVRRLLRSPMFLVVTLITLAAGLGANTVVFSVLEGVLLKPLPYPHPEELVGVQLTAPAINLPSLNLAPSNYFIIREQGRTFQEFGMYNSGSVSITGLAEPERVRELEVNAGTLAALGVHPVMGRAFREEDDTAGAPLTAIITYGFWQRKFGGDASAVGRALVVDGKQTEIIGVMPASFHFLDQIDPAVITPMQLDRSKTHLGNFSYMGIARLKPGVTLEQASADVARLLPITLASFPAPEGFSIKLFEDAHIGPNLHPLKQDVVGDVGSVLWVLMGSIILVLLIACANVANLMLVRVESRRQEIALRAALGASWSRIAGEMFLESAVLGLAGGALGLGLAYGGLKVLVSVATGIPRLREIGLDGQVLLFAFLAALTASLLSTALPVIKHAGARLTGAMREGGRGLSQSREQHRARSVLVVLQVTLALVLLICSGLMLRTFHALTQVNPGFTDPASLQAFRISIPETLIKDDEQVVRTQEAILRKIEAIPGVTRAAVSSSLPLSGDNWSDPVFLENVLYPEGKMPPLRKFRFVSPGTMAALGIPMVAGRDLTWDDTYKKTPVALVSENFARENWRNPSEAIGKRIRVSTKDAWREIAGVVGDVRADGVDKPAPTIVYWPLLVDQFEGGLFTVMRYVTFTIRTPRADSESFLKELRQAVWQVNANLPLSDVHTLDYYYQRSMARTSFTLLMLATAGGMALLLGVVGIYGVIAYSVSQRTREIGIRMALGAQQGTLTGMFVRHGLLLTGIGVVCGLATAAVTMRLMSSLLFQVNPVDPLTYAAVSAGLLATAALACYIPSRRAASMDPIEALRAE
jgi:predicted permease